MSRPSGPHRPRKGRTCTICATTYNATCSEQRTCGSACGSLLSQSTKTELGITIRQRWPQCRVYLAECSLCARLFAGPTKRMHCSDDCRRTARRIDHVVPLARGGDDTPSNVQLAHFLCNSTKGASMPSPEHVTQRDTRSIAQSDDRTNARATLGQTTEHEHITAGQRHDMGGTLEAGDDGRQTLPPRSRFRHPVSPPVVTESDGPLGRLLGVS